MCRCLTKKKVLRARVIAPLYLSPFFQLQLLCSWRDWLAVRQAPEMLHHHLPYKCVKKSIFLFSSMLVFARPHRDVLIIDINTIGYSFPHKRKANRAAYDNILTLRISGPILGRDSSMAAL